MRKSLTVPATVTQKDILIVLIVDIKIVNLIINI